MQINFIAIIIIKVILVKKHKTNSFSYDTGLYTTNIEHLKTSKPKKKIY